MPIDCATPHSISVKTISTPVYVALIAHLVDETSMKTSKKLARVGRGGRMNCTQQESVGIITDPTCFFVETLLLENKVAGCILSYLLVFILPSLLTPASLYLYLYLNCIVYHT